jgi:hypothetical protein
VARPCTTCLHPARAAVERALLDGEPSAHVADRFGIPRTSLRRHAARHLAPSLAKAVARREDVNADSLVSWLSDLHAKALVGMETARRKGDLTAMRGLIAEDRQTCALLARVAGILVSDGGPTLNVNLDARRQEVFASLSEPELRALAALDGEPEAVEVEARALEVGA